MNAEVGSNILHRILGSSTSNHAFSIDKLFGPRDSHKVCFDFMELEYNSLDIPDDEAEFVRYEQGSTPLIRACYHGHVDIVVKLLDEYHVDIEEMGSIRRVEGHMPISLLCQKIVIEPPKLVRPLYVAVYTHNVDVLKALIERKALINATSINGETALHSACFKGEMDVVKLLIKNGADIHLADGSDLTCIMHAARGGSVDVTKYFVRKGQNLNQTNKHGQSALDYYAISHSRKFKYFISYTNTKSLYRALLMAAANSNSEFVTRCIRKKCFSRKQEVDAFLLLGSSFIDFSAMFACSKHCHIMDCYENFQLAMDLKWKNIRKYEKSLKGEEGERFTALPTKEIETFEDLRNLGRNLLPVVKQCLLIQGRILGPIDPIFFRTYSSTLDNLTPPERLHINIYALLQLQDKFETDHKSYNAYFSSLASTLETVSLDIACTYVNELIIIFSNTVLCLDSSLQQPKENEEVMENFGTNILNLLLFIQFFITSRKDLTSERWSSVKTLVERFVKWKPICCNGRSPLHYVFQGNSYNCDLFKFLLKGGADVNAVDNDENTPLHILANNPSSKISVESLLKSGSHIDVHNANRETPLQLMSSETLSSIDVFDYIKLKCLCSRILKSNSASRLDRLPKSLQILVNFH